MLSFILWCRFEITVAFETSSQFKSIENTVYCSPSLFLYININCASKGWTVLLYDWLFQKLILHEFSEIEAVTKSNLDNGLFIPSKVLHWNLADAFISLCGSLNSKRKFPTNRRNIFRNERTIFDCIHLANIYHITCALHVCAIVLVHIYSFKLLLSEKCDWNCNGKFINLL